MNGIMSLVATPLWPCLASVTAADMGTSVLEDVAASTVIRCERKASGARVSAARAFHADCERDIARPLRPGPPASPGVQFATFHIAGHFWRSDATNSSVWQGCQLQNCQLRSLYVTDPKNAGSFPTS